MDEPQSLQIRQPSSYTRLSEPHSVHFPFALVPFGMYFLSALSTPFFPVVYRFAVKFQRLNRFTTSWIGISWRRYSRYKLGIVPVFGLNICDNPSKIFLYPYLSVYWKSYLVFPSSVFTLMIFPLTMVFGIGNISSSPDL